MKKIFPKKEARILFTGKGYQRVLAEKDKLLAERPEAVEHLRKAREMGDLSENGYYKASRARLSFLDSRIRRVERFIRLGVIVESSQSGIVDIGKKVKLTDGQKEYEYEIVGGYESDPSKHAISHQSPLGRALMGKREHETVTVEAPSGTTRYTVLAIK